MFQRRSFMVALLHVVLLAACTQAPQQGVGGSPIQVDWEGHRVPTSGPIDIPLPPPIKTDDEKARENSLKPILYGEGAAGISFKTTLNVAKELLSKPFYGPQASDGLTAYNEGALHLVASQSAPHTGGFSHYWELPRQFGFWCRDRQGKDGP
ncbi:MAG: hypothetical protein R3B54_18695 [Bdellovibrionota bacterium]